MKLKNVLLTTMSIILTSATFSYADSYDNPDPSAGNDNGMVQGTEADNNAMQNTGIVPPNLPISRDGETMGDEDY